MEEKQFKLLDDKLDKLTKLLSVIALKDIEKEQDKIGLLDTIGFRPVEIAKLLNKSQENVGVQLGIIRKKLSKTEQTDASQASDENPKAPATDAMVQKA